MARVQQWLTTKLKQKSQEHRKGKGKKGRNLMDELLIASYDFLWNVAHDDCMNRTKRMWLTVSTDFFEIQFIIMRMYMYATDSLISETMFPINLFSHWAAKYFVCFPLV